MATGVLPIHDLAQRISQQEADLAKLNQEFKARQAQMRELTRRKEEIRAQLRHVEAEIKGMGQGGAPPGLKPPGKTTSANKAAAATTPKPAPSKPGKKSTGGMTLAQLILKIVAKAGRPVTVKDLTLEAVRRKYPTTSQNLAGMMENRVGELVKKGLLRRAPNQPGVLPGRPHAATPPSPSVKSNGSMPAKSLRTPLVAKNTANRPSASESKLTLPVAITRILAQSTKPLLARELAAKVKASGYHSKSKDFVNVIWVGVGKMNNVENVQGAGYRLKKSKTLAPVGKAKGSK